MALLSLNAPYSDSELPNEEKVCHFCRVNYIHISVAVYGLFTSITNKQKQNKTKTHFFVFFCFVLVFVCLFVFQFNAK